MKLNATSEMIPVTNPLIANLHPFVPQDQALGLIALAKDLEKDLCEITGFDAVSLQPNSGAQGEYAGLIAIRRYLEAKGQGHRKICLIPASAHGTNPASAAILGMDVVVVACDSMGNVDVDDLQTKAQKHAKDLAALMITYPSTHGVFEESFTHICRIIHEHGGQVYMDGANYNALVGWSRPGLVGADVCHMNLHKTFCIPHGGGGPGVGPIGVKSHLADFLPGHFSLGNSEGAVTAAAYGSASILPISWMYIKMMGQSGLAKATAVAVLNANYIARKLSPYYPVLYTGKNSLVAHECILDTRPLKISSKVTVDDIAKRLIDYGFHAPTMSFPVSGTLMVEPSESESLYELDRFIQAMIAIRGEIKAIEEGKISYEHSPLPHAPFTAFDCLSENWAYSFTRKEAAFPAGLDQANKYWPPVGRLDHVYGDKNLVCTCADISTYA